MIKTILKIDGMMCGMCESHINDVIRNQFHVKKVKSSHTKGECVILSEEELDEGQLHDAIAKTGYELVKVITEDDAGESAEKKGGFFSILHR